MWYPRLNVQEGKKEKKEKKKKEKKRKEKRALLLLSCLKIKWSLSIYSNGFQVGEEWNLALDVVFRRRQVQLTEDHQQKQEKRS